MKLDIATINHAIGLVKCLSGPTGLAAVVLVVVEYKVDGVK